MKSKTRIDLRNEHRGSGYMILANTPVEVLRTEHGSAVIRGPGFQYSCNHGKQPRETTVVLRVSLQNIEEIHVS